MFPRMGLHVAVPEDDSDFHHHSLSRFSPEIALWSRKIDFEFPCLRGSGGPCTSQLLAQRQPTQ